MQAGDCPGAPGFKLYKVRYNNVDYSVDYNTDLVD